EPNCRLRYPKCLVEALDEVEVVADELVRDHPRSDGLGDLDERRLHVSLSDANLIVEGHVELRQVCPLRVEEHFYLGLQQLSQSYEPLSWCYLVPKTLADLRKPLRQFDSLGLEEKRHVHEDALARLRTQISFLSQGPYADPEHHIEPLCSGQGVLALGADDVVLGKERVVLGVLEPLGNDVLDLLLDDL